MIYLVGNDRLCVNRNRHKSIYTHLNGLMERREVLFARLCAPIQWIDWNFEIQIAQICRVAAIANQLKHFSIEFYHLLQCASASASERHFLENEHQATNSKCRCRTIKWTKKQIFFLCFFVVLNRQHCIHTFSLRFKQNKWPDTVSTSVCACEWVRSR